MASGRRFFRGRRTGYSLNFHFEPKSALKRILSQKEVHLLLDEVGHFKGVIDDNLAGEDTILNIFMSMGLYSGFGQLQRLEQNPRELPNLKQKTQKARIEGMREIFKALKVLSLFWT